MGLQGWSSNGEPKYVQSLVDSFDNEGSEAMNGSSNAHFSFGICHE